MLLFALAFYEDRQWRDFFYNIGVTRPDSGYVGYTKLFTMEIKLSTLNDRLKADINEGRLVSIAWTLTDGGSSLMFTNRWESIVVTDYTEHLHLEGSWEPLWQLSSLAPNSVYLTHFEIRCKYSSLEWRDHSLRTNPVPIDALYPGMSIVIILLKTSLTVLITVASLAAGGGFKYPFQEGRNHLYHQLM